ncbi:MAG: RNA polymerase sigma factor [Oscillospiraceae bacterium]|jgi:RNA polymerase sigma-70 factor (ECF subfamily)|nr:RNA polymerase sigma factor [Oscillospiraceae bacterium]
MTKEAFIEQILALRSTLYYLSYSLLPNHADQEDAVQACLEKALRKRTTLREDAYLKTWLIRILINECHNVLRRKRREVPTEEIIAVAPPDADMGLFEAVSQLDPKLRIVLVLHCFEGYTTREVALMLRTPESTVKSRLKRARTLLGQQITQQNEEVWA